MNKFSIRKRWPEKIWEKNVTIALNVLYAKLWKASYSFNDSKSRKTQN